MIKIFLCCYNGEAYIRPQLDSILSQETDEDFEIIVSDDASNDGSLKILNEYENNYRGKIRVLKRSNPSGSACKHFLSLFAQGYAEGADAVFLSDQDDVWKPDKLKKTMEALRAVELLYGKKTPVLVHCDSEVADTDLKPIAGSFIKYQKISPERTKLNQLLVQNVVTGASMAVNASLASFVESVPEFAVMHDHWFALLASCFGEIRFLPKQLYIYRQHTDNTLGAEKGSIFKEVLGRFGLFRTDGMTKAEVDEKSRNVYLGIFRQAKCFLEMYKDRLSPDQKKIIKDFLEIEHLGRIKKIQRILAGHYTYNLPHRTVGECLFI